jgi:hypothetical protein
MPPGDLAKRPPDCRLGPAVAHRPDRLTATFGDGVPRGSRVGLSDYALPLIPPRGRLLQLVPPSLAGTVHQSAPRPW